VSTRAKNEGWFPDWVELSEGGRLYRREIAGRSGGSAKYFKQVDADEKTVRFWQEIYDQHSRLIEGHEKYPVDLGHQKL